MDDKRVTPEDLPDLKRADTVGMAEGKLPASAAAMRRGFTKMPAGQFGDTVNFPDSGNPMDWPNGYER